MSDWKITGSSRSDDPADIAMEMATFGLVSRPSKYEVTNTETGDVKHVWANNEKQVGEAIARGNLRK